MVRVTMVLLASSLSWATTMLVTPGCELVPAVNNGRGLYVHVL